MSLLLKPFKALGLGDIFFTLPAKQRLMTPKDIKDIYKVIFNSYDSQSMEKNIERIIKLDTFLPYSSTFFCITNTQDLTFDYVSKNVTSCLGMDRQMLKQEGMRSFWSRIHPDDIQLWLQALNDLMAFTIDKIPEEQRQLMSYTWNYRFKHCNGSYVNIVQNTSPLGFDTQMKPIIGLAHYTVLDTTIKMDVTATAKLLTKSGAYETKYYNNFSKKLLSNNISNRERDVIRLLLLNHSSKAIAKQLNISSHTVDTHRRNILKKLNISSTGELVAILKINETII